MNCEEAQQEILMADDPGAAAARPEIAEHARGCGLCSPLVAQLSKMEGAARTLPVMGAMAERPSPLVMERIAAAAKAPAKNTGCLKRVLRGAVAAAILITVGLIAITMLTSTRPARAEAVYGDLVAWNLKISQASPAMRDALYREKLGDMKKEVDSLTAGDRALAEKLLANAQLLVQANDPIAESSRFVEIAAQLQARGKSLSDKAAAAQMETLYQNVLTQGIQSEMNRVDPKTLPAPEKLKFDELQKSVPQGLPSTLPPGPGAMLPAIPAGGGGNWTQLRGSAAGAPPVSPTNPLHDFMPGRPYAWSPPSGTIVVTGTAASTPASHGGTKSSGTPADSSSSTPAASTASNSTLGTSTDGSGGDSLGGGKSDTSENLPTITQGTAGPVHTPGGLGDLSDPADFDTGTATTSGSGRHDHGDGSADDNIDWTWGGRHSDYADGSMPGWMRFDIGNGTNGPGSADGRHVADEVPLSGGCLDDADITSGPEGSPLSSFIKHSQVDPGFVDFDGTGSMSAGSGAVALPEPGAGLLLGLGAAILLRRRKRAN